MVGVVVVLVMVAGMKFGAFQSRRDHDESSSSARSRILVPSRHEGRIVFVCDGSGSMAARIGQVRAELRAALHRLSQTQAFNIIVSQEAGCESVRPRALLAATKANQRVAREFLANIKPRGESDAVAALQEAFSLRPEVIYFITDSDFSRPTNEAVLALCRELNSTARVRINTVVFANPQAEVAADRAGLMRTMAEESGGTFVVAWPR